MTGSVAMIRHNLVGTYTRAAKNPASTTPVDAKKVVVGLRETWLVLKPSARSPHKSKPRPTHHESRP